ncbi:hypothetical protein F5141DRAFT_72626 [Pisolithus sp. B1]|nr:hypothetical protein F5141DRAFT_72626 [Pisolithus sp. B1]
MGVNLLPSDSTWSTHLTWHALEESASMAKFRLDNPEQFSSIVNLLSLRNDSQFQPRNEEECEDITACEDKGDEIKQRFLDRFAEMMSIEKDGKYVCCVAFRKSDRTVEEDDKLSLIVARNADLDETDKKFLSRVEVLLTAIGASVYKESNSISVVKELWEELLRYNQPHLDRYAESLRNNLEALKAAGALDSVPAYYTPKLPQNDDSKHRKNFDVSSIQKRILELDTILCTGDRATRWRLLAEHTYSICRMKSLRIFINSHSKASVWHGLLSDVLFLGRLRPCHYTLVEGALNIPGFAHLSIILVKNLPRRVRPITLPPLADAMKFLGLTLDPTSARNFISEKLGITDAERAFKRLRNTVSGQRLSTHAELQLVLHIARTMDIKTMSKEVYPYIGCSKLSCFLCSTFLASFDYGGVAFRTRGRHRRIHRLWSIPDVGGLRADMVIALHSALNKTRDLLVREIIKPIPITPHVSKFTAGVADYSRQSSFAHRYNKNLPGLRGSDLLSASASKDSLRNLGPVEVETCEILGVFEYFETSALYGKCENCERKTARKCSKCREPWLCSDHCENDWDYYEHIFTCATSRPLDTADYLVRACWTDFLDDLDEATEEDFGFAKFALLHDVQKLFGLYIGLICYMGVGSRELHKWQKEGTLTENIIAKYELLPKCDRGRYYLWFREHLHIFNSRGGLDFLAVARPYLDPADREKDPHQLVPEAKCKSFILYAMLLNGWYPNPFFESDKRLYFEFGFVTGYGYEGEQVLPMVYRSLIPECSFTEFWTAFQSNNLVALMDAKGLGPVHKEVRHFEGFMKMEGNSCCPTVWHLRLFLNSLDADPPGYVAADYGFLNCKTVEEKLSLKEIYTGLLESPTVDPMEMHAACTKGKLYDFVRRHKPSLEKRFKKLMSNIYPL